LDFAGTSVFNTELFLCTVAGKLKKMEIKKKVIMEIITILVYLVVFFLVIQLFDRKPKKPTIPGEVPDTYTGELVSRYFIWTKPGISKTYKLNTIVQVRTEAYEAARDELLSSSPSKTTIYSDSGYFNVAQSEILHEEFGAHNFELMQVSSYLSHLCNAEVLSDYEFASIILSFTQEKCFAYTSDKESTGHSEYLRFPLETIFDTTGDCDCKAILASALFKTLGFRVAFAIMPSHAALAITLPDDDLPFSNFVMKGKRWFYCETTGDEWNPGQLPDGIDPKLIELMEI
jgi:hypothetical protein